MTSRPILKTLQQKILEYKSKTRLTTQEILKLAQDQGTLMKKNEISWMRELIKYLPAREETFSTIDFLTTVKNKKKRSHKRQAKFYLDIFEYLGCNYRKWK